MDIIFKNRISKTKDVYKELYKYCFFQRKLLVLAYAILFLDLLYGIYLSIAFGEYFLVFIVAFLFAFQFFRYFMTVEMSVKRDKEIFDGEIETEIIVTNEYIQATSSNGSVVKVEFEKIKNTVQTKNLILLFTKANLVFVFGKDAFEIGTKEELLSFLKTKNIVVKEK